MVNSKREQQDFRLAAIGHRQSQVQRRHLVWLLEDSPFQAEQAKRALAEYDVVHFEDGGALLEQLAQSAPNVLILDWEVPGVSGRDVLRFVRETRDEVTLPILVFTSDEPAILEALTLGANDFVAKPCPDVVLSARVRALARVHTLGARTRAAEQERTDALERVYDAETRMYVALEAADIGTWELDARTYVMQLDAGSQAIMGVAAKVDFADAERVVHEDDRVMLREAFAASLDPARRAPFAVEYRVRRPDGTERWNAAWARAMFNGDHAERLVGAMLDATQRKHATAVMERDALFRERFIAILAHDLRTPLTALRLGAQILTRRAVSEAVAKDLGLRVEATTKRMDRMIADLLDFTRTRQGGGMPVDVVDADLAAICRGVIEEVQVSAPGRSITFEVHGDTLGRCDPGRLGQIVSNLVSNAVDYSPPASAVRVTLRGADEFIVLEVQNGGATIEEGTLQSLFDPFRRGASATSSRGSRGLGLGLYIVEQIVRAHGGSVSARSTDGEGTSFTVSLPRRLTRSPPAP